MAKAKYFYSFQILRKNGSLFSNGQGILQFDRNDGVEEAERLILDVSKKYCDSKGVSFPEDAMLHVMALNRI